MPIEVAAKTPIHAELLAFWMPQAHPHYVCVHRQLSFPRISDEPKTKVRVPVINKLRRISGSAVPAKYFFDILDVRHAKNRSYAKTTRLRDVNKNEFAFLRNNHSVNDSQSPAPVQSDLDPLYQSTSFVYMANTTISARKSALHALTLPRGLPSRARYGWMSATRMRLRSFGFLSLIPTRQVNLSRE
jgi:hypothetical protein